MKWAGVSKRMKAKQENIETIRFPKSTIDIERTAFGVETIGEDSSEGNVWVDFVGCCDSIKNIYYNGTKEEYVSKLEPFLNGLINIQELKKNNHVFIVHCKDGDIVNKMRQMRLINRTFTLWTVRLYFNRV